ncbi:site-2 protease family protein [Halovivax sp.]|uniref:site-2 protease family protein n=1 Tax=Halovivax sp. TaxID=1935978 RepID=UPI0025BF583F|nr:site-2 protease family protein [Halovivax sp.]
MFKSFRIGSVIGIPVKLDVTLLLILPVFAWLIAFQVGELVPILNDLFGTEIAAEALTDGSTPWVLGTVAAVGLFASVFLHELGHSVVAIRYGFPIDSITLWLLGGVAQLSEQPREWRQELLIAIAGPIVSVGLGVAFYALAVVAPAALDAVATAATIDAVVFVVAYLAVLNVVLAAFNMLPGFPMDGGRVLRALLSRNRSFAVATAQAAQVGKWFALLIGLFGVLALNFILVAVAFFIYIAAAAEARQTALQAAVEGITVRDMMTPGDEIDTVEPTLPVAELLDLMLHQRHTGYPVLRGGRIVGIVTLEDVRAVPPERREATTVEDVMTTDELETVAPDDDAMAALAALQRNDIGRVLVFDDGGDLAGLVTRTDVVTALDIGFVRAAGSHLGVPGPKGRADPPPEGPRW